ncbi:MAG: family 43 glycosylhydrolase, partial [Chitinophagaceae bacterium]|nr:family 43 glycosylhydrolase [Chitinophagaceae bacterium]
EGPYIPQATPIAGVRGIDPNVFIDKDGQAYLYWSAGNIYGAKLKANMLELDSEVKILGELPTKGLKEGPFVFERNGIYYMTYPHVENKTERLEYAIGTNPLGPFKIVGAVMDESASGCWTNHHSIIPFKNQWYLFYHDKDYSPKFDKARSVRIDSLSFNADGTIKKVIPTLRGVGVTAANKQIQIDRYTQLSEQGVSIAFIDTLNTFKGWKTNFNAAGAWLQYNTVDFGKKPLKRVTVNAMSTDGAVLQVRANSINGPVIAELLIPKSSEWKLTKAAVLKPQTGVHNLFVVSKDGKQVEADWISFE